jgi:hypothetical protein
MRLDSPRLAPLAWAFDLFDGQLPTSHLASIGLAAWPRERFHAPLAGTLRRPTRCGRWRLDPELLARALGRCGSLSRTRGGG